MNTWLFIVGMSAVTFFTRYAFLCRNIEITLNERWQKLLEFTVPALLTAFWAPMVFVPHGANTTTLMSPELLAGLFAITISLITKHTLLTVILGMACFYLLRQFL